MSRSRFQLNQKFQLRKAHIHTHAQTKRWLNHLRLKNKKVFEENDKHIDKMIFLVCEERDYVVWWATQHTEVFKDSRHKQNLI